jgi:hypothetical protein
MTIRKHIRDRRKLQIDFYIIALIFLKKIPNGFSTLDHPR